MKKWVVMLLMGVGVASGDPSMTVTTTVNLGEFDGGNPGLELQFVYDVTNTSAAGDVNNMISWSIPAGSDDGVLGIVVSYDGFDGYINEFIASGTAGFTGNLPPDVVSNYVQIVVITPARFGAVPGQAGAVAEGEDDGGPGFPPVGVEVPGEVGLKVLGIGAERVGVGVEVGLAVGTVGGRLLVGGVAVEHAPEPSGPWSGIGTIPGDGTSYAGTVIAPEGGTGFIRVKVP